MFPQSKDYKNMKQMVILTRLGGLLRPEYDTKVKRNVDSGCTKFYFWLAIVTIPNSIPSLNGPVHLKILQVSPGYLSFNAKTYQISIKGVLILFTWESSPVIFSKIKSGFPRIPRFIITLYTVGCLKKTYRGIFLLFLWNWAILIFLSSFYVFWEQFYQHNDIFTEVFSLIIALMLIILNIIMEIFLKDEQISFLSKTAFTC